MFFCSSFCHLPFLLSSVLILRRQGQNQVCTFVSLRSLHCNWNSVWIRFNIPEYIYTFSECITIFFSAFTLLVTWWKGSPACKKSCTSNTQRFFCGKLNGDGPAQCGVNHWKNRPVKQKAKVAVNASQCTCTMLRFYYSISGSVWSVFHRKLWFRFFPGFSFYRIYG